MRPYKTIFISLMKEKSTTRRIKLWDISEGFGNIWLENFHGISDLIYAAFSIIKFFLLSMDEFYI